MIHKEVSCIIAVTFVTLVYGTKNLLLLADEYEYYPGVGYYYLGTQKSWWDAQKDCMSSKARLAVINSEEEKEAIVSFLSKYTQDEYVYAGFTNWFETQYVTTDGVPLNDTGYTNWKTGFPTGQTHRCGRINTKTGQLADTGCDKAMSYICEQQLWKDYAHAEGFGYYKLHTEGKGWADAYQVCKSEGAHLLIIDSQEEADIVKEIYNYHPYLTDTQDNDRIYIGFRVVIEDLRDNPHGGTYLTIFGTSVSDLGYVKWHEDQPVPAKDAFCGALSRGDAAYVSYYCGSKLAFFCERELQDFHISG